MTLALIIAILAVPPLAWLIGILAVEHSLMSALKHHRGRFVIRKGYMDAPRIRTRHTPHSGMCPLALITWDYSEEDHRTLHPYRIDNDLLLRELGLDARSRLLIVLAADGAVTRTPGTMQRNRLLTLIDNWRIKRFHRKLLTLTEAPS